MVKRSLLALSLAAAAMAAAQAQPSFAPTSQDPASAQPSIPKPMPNLVVPVPANPGETAAGRRPPRATAHRAKRRTRTASRRAWSVDRPALANVELLEPLPHPPQPPHVTVQTPAYPFEDFVTYYTAPPPPVVCRPTRYDRFKPDLGLADERPVLCTADNP